MPLRLICPGAMIGRSEGDMEKMMGKGEDGVRSGSSATCSGKVDDIFRLGFQYLLKGNPRR